MNVGFIGLGNIGKAIAGRLIEKGIPLTVYNRTASKTEGLDAAVAATPAAACAGEVIFLCLFDSAAVEEILTGDDGLLQLDLSGKTIVDLTTNHFEDAEGFADTISALGASYVEAPVIGSVIPAAKGALTVLVSGDEAAYEKVLSYLQIIGSTIFYLGEPGMASRMKLVNNMVLGSFMAAIAEGLSLGVAAGFTPETVLQLLEAGAGNSMVLSAKKAKLLENDFSPHFSVGAIFKDLHYMQDLAKQMGRPAFTGSTAKELFAMAIKQGLEDEDFSAVYEALK